MIRWASCGLFVALTASVGAAQTADVISEVTDGVQPRLRPNPFGGAPIPIAARPAVAVAAQIKALPAPAQAPGGAPDQPVPGPGGTRPLRPVFMLPGPPKLDRHGDPLPAGAVARFGTVRLRHGNDVQGLGFTHDGKFLCTVSASDDSVKMWDAATGKEVARLDTGAGLVALMKDGSLVLVDDTRVRVWLPAAKTVRDLPEKTLPEGSAPTALAVNPDGRSFAVATDGKVLLLDLQTGKALKDLNLPGPPPNKPMPPGAVPPPAQQPAGPPVPTPTKLLFSPDGRWLLGSGQKTGVWLWDLRSGKRVRTYRTEADFPEYAFSPDVTRIVVTGERLHLYAIDSEEPIDGFRGPENLPAFAPRFSADGKAVFVVLTDASVLPLDAATGEQKEGLDAPEMNLRPPFALAPGGTTAAALDQSAGIHIWDPKTGKGPEVTRLPSLGDPGFTADGKSATVLDVTNKIHTFDRATGAPGKAIELPGEDTGIPATWDAVNRRAAVPIPSGDDLEIQIVDADTGKVVAKHSVPQAGGVPAISFARANRDRMALTAQTGEVTVLNPTNGKMIRSFTPPGLGNGGPGVMSPDGRAVAVNAHPVTVWEVATGKKRLTIDAIPNASVLVYSPDSRLLGALVDTTGTVVIADARTGSVVRRLQSADADEGVNALAFSPDGKKVAVGTQPGRVTVWDVATGETLAPFAGHDGTVTGLVFSPDGKLLLSTAADGTALVWEIPDKALPTRPVEAAVSGFDEAFRLLGAAEAAQAQRGLDYLYRNPADAVKQVGDRMPAPAAVPAAKLAQLVADLGSEEFATREAARKELEKVSGEAAALLKEAVTNSPSPEVRKVAAELLGRIDSPAVRPDELSVLRAVEALEHIGTPAARAQLDNWAAGPTGHRLTTEAAAAVARLKATGR